MSHSHPSPLTPLDPPSAPFLRADSNGLNSSNSSIIGSGTLSPGIGANAKAGGSTSDLSLTINYLPSKFSATMLSPGGPRRRPGKGGKDMMIPKRGGGVEAFRSGEARMPGIGDEDYDGVSTGFGFNKQGKKMRWNKFKWTLFIANTLLTLYSLTSLIFCLLTWFNVWTHADIIRVGNGTELILSTIAASLGILTSLIGWSGILLNNRAFLAVYTFMLWIVFAFLVTPGYVTFKRRNQNLEGKINEQWSRNLGVLGRQRIQDQLGCCGYFSPFVEATVSSTCYARSILPGCKLPYMQFERMVLARWYAVAFGLVPVHIFVIVSGLLCSNHVTYRFGKGMMPKRYRLSMGSMAVIMDSYASQLAEQYGEEVAKDLLARSRSQINLAQPPDATQASGGYGQLHNKYDS